MTRASTSDALQPPGQRPPAPAVPASALPGSAVAEGHTLSAGEAMDLATTFRVLADPTRVRLIAALLGGEQAVGALAAVVGMSESAVSHQLRVLRAARIVRGRPDGRQVFYTLDDAHVVTLFRQALSHVTEGAAVEGDDS